MHDVAPRKTHGHRWLHRVSGRWGCGRCGVVSGVGHGTDVCSCSDRRARGGGVERTEPVWRAWYRRMVHVLRMSQTIAPSTSSRPATSRPSSGLLSALKISRLIGSSERSVQMVPVSWTSRTSLAERRMWEGGRYRENSMKRARVCSLSQFVALRKRSTSRASVSLYSGTSTTKPDSLQQQQHASALPLPGHSSLAITAGSVRVSVVAGLLACRAHTSRGCPGGMPGSTPGTESPARFLRTWLAALAGAPRPHPLRSPESWHREVYENSAHRGV